MRAEVLGIERRRRWPRDAKARVGCGDAGAGGLHFRDCPAERHRASLLFTWRRRARLQAPAAEPIFLPVEVTEMPAVVPVPVAAPVKRRRRKAAGMIEIALGSGHSLKVGADVDAAALARVLDVLERR